MATEECPADPQGRELNSDCSPDPCVPWNGAPMSTSYVVGHVPGSDIGATSGKVQHCTVPTTPTTVSPTLPVTGNTNALWLTIAGACSALLGLLLVRAARR